VAGPGNEMNGWERVTDVWQLAVAVFSIVFSLIAAAHAVMYRRDSRAALAWVGFIWVVPLVGALLYFIFGINRIRRRASELRESVERYQAQTAATGCALELLWRDFPSRMEHLRPLAHMIEEVVGRPLLTGNRIDPLVDGDAAYPAMLEAMENAQRSLSFSTYIFDRDEAGLAFARALGGAVRRGVAVRVLIDAAGTRYSWPPILKELKREGVPYARFLPVVGPWRVMSVNLRSHRKILVVDGHVGFTGGMNIRVGHWLARKPRNPVQDIHFRVEGPVVAQLQEAFADDWLFTTRERLKGGDWFPGLDPAGPVLARGIPDGPDEDLDKLRWAMMGALATARSSVMIMTPYFLPDPGLISMLNLAALRGARVDILLPERNNLPFVQWASRALWWQVLEHRCRIWLTPPPFDHSKLMIVDGGWTLLGSANWDPRSLRLNFEYNLECYDTALAEQLTHLLHKKLQNAREVTLQEVDSRGVPARLRDGIARLLTPYL
jgi:cardiolipin synthase A/B